MARSLVGADPQLAAGEGGPSHDAQLLGAEFGVDRDQGEGLKDVDLADVGALDSALVGQGADDRAGKDPVSVAHLDAVNGPGALVLAAPGTRGRAASLATVAPFSATVLLAPAFEGGRQEGPLGVEVLLPAGAPGALTATVLAPARSLVAHGEGQQRGRQLLDVDVQLPSGFTDQRQVHVQTAALMAGGGLGQELSGPVLGDVRGGGQGDLLQTASGEALDLAELALLLGGQEGDGLAVATGAARAADTVDVGLSLAGHVEVDDQADAVHVKPAGGHVGGHQHVEGAGAQTLHQTLALTLRHVTGDGGGLDAPARQLDGDVLGRGLGAHEDDGGLGVGDGKDPGNGADLVAEGNHRVGLVDGGDGGGGPRDLDLDGLVKVLARHGLDGRGHRRREQGGAPLGGKGLRNRPNVLGEAPAQHLVGLVQNEVAHVVEQEGALVNEVDDASGGADDDLGAALERADLGTVGGTAVDGHHVQPAGTGGHVGDGLGALEGELASGGQDKGLDHAVTGVDGVQERQTEGRGLSGSGLSDADDVTAGQQNRDRLPLNGGGVHEAHVGDGLEQVAGQSQVGEGDLIVLVVLLRLAPALTVTRSVGALALVLWVRIGVDEGSVAVDLILIDVDAVVLIGVLILRVGLGAVPIDVVGLVLVVDVLRVLGRVGGGRSGEVLGGGGGVVGVVRCGNGVVVAVCVSRVSRPAAGELGGEERVETQGAVALGALSVVGGAGHSAAGGSHEVFPSLSP